jgi:hypothetical protein
MMSLIRFADPLRFPKNRHPRDFPHHPYSRD